MDAAEIAQVYNWLQQHGINACPLCGGAPLDVKSQVGALVPIIGGAIAINGQHVALLPVVSVMCPQCAHIMNFATNPIGIQP